MGHFRFRRSFGTSLVKFNVSKSGFSMTSGVPGAHLNIPLVGTRRRRSMLTLGLPGSGLSYRQPIGRGRRVTQTESSIGHQVMAVVIFLLVAWWFFGHVIGG